MIAPPLAGNVIGSVDASFVVAEWKDAGGSPGPPRWIAPPHLHHNDNQDETGYVLEGAMCVRVGKDVVEARSGSVVFAPRARLIRIGIRVPDQCDMYWW
jgi:mannose-6-phosphate isomerase-like protein (cupin superfamily)